MSGDHWERVQLLFDELIELDTSHRHARLDLLSRTDPDLSDELRSLLGAHERAGVVGARARGGTVDDVAST